MATLAAIGALHAFALAARTTTADGRPGFEVLDLVVDEEIYAEICDSLKLSDVQRDSIRPIFDDYLASVRLLDAATDRAAEAEGANDIGGLVLHARQRGEENPWRDTVELTQNVLKVWAAGNREADALLSQFLGQMDVVLQKPNGAEDVRVVERLVRRRNFLVKPVDPNVVSKLDFARPVDMLTVLAEASADGQELATLPCVSGEEDHLPAECRAACGRLPTYRVDYELSADTLICSLLEDRRVVDRPPSKDGILHPGDAAAANYLRQRRGRHCQFLRANHDFAAQVTELARECLGDQNARRWESRVWCAMAPSVGRTMWLDELIGDNGGLMDWDDSQRAQAAILYEDFFQRRHEMRQAAYEQGLLAACRHLTVWGTEENQLRFATRLAAIDDLHKQAIETTRALLRSEQLAGFDAARRAAFVSGADLFETIMPISVLKLLGRDESNIQHN